MVRLMEVDITAICMLANDLSTQMVSVSMCPGLWPTGQWTHACTIPVVLYLNKQAFLCFHFAFFDG